MLTLPLLVSVLLIALGNYLFTRWFIRYAKFRRITDIPTDRSSHESPTPKGGGVGFAGITLLGFAVYIGLNGLFSSGGLTACLVILAVSACLGWFDDRHDLSKRFRFGFQLLAAFAVIYFIAEFHLVYIPFLALTDIGMLGTVLALFWITGTANIYNFMDGIDGIASVQAIGASIGWMVLATLWGLPELFVLNFFILATVSTFLFFNWSPARIFMGDVGSLFLGFSFAIMPFLAANLSDTLVAGDVVWLAGLILWPFLFDGAYTIFRRLSREENIFEGHRSHLYQRLNISGWSHKRISFLYFIFSLFCVVVALLFNYTGDIGKVTILVMLLILSLLYILFVKSVEKAAGIPDRS